MSSSSHYLDPTIHQSSPIASSSKSSMSSNLGQFILPPLPDLGVPPLPPIPDKNLERQAFTHSSFIGKPRNLQSLLLDGLILDNEKMEHVGDGIVSE